MERTEDRITNTIRGRVTMMEGRRLQQTESKGLRAKISAVVSRFFGQVMALPSFLYILLLIGVPTAYLLYLSMTKNFFSPIQDTQFVGIANLVAVLGSANFWVYFGNTIFYTVAVIAAGITIQIGIALALNTDLPFKRLWHSLIILPWAIPFVLSTTIWKLMFHPTFGVINYLIAQVGLSPIAWFSGKWSAFFTIIMATIWINTPLAVLILLAGLDNIPERLYEASRIDGAGIWNRFRHVTLPLLRPSLMAVLLIETLLALRGFEVVWAMTKGGPGDATTIIVIDIYKQLIQFGNIAYAAAESIILILLVLFVLVLIQKIVSPDHDVEVE
jgi:multiple sugar transport system permease protein